MSLEIGRRRRILVYGPSLLVLTLVQLHLSVTGAFPPPDFLLLLPLLAGLWTPGYDGFILGLTAGFIRDFAAGRGYGPGMLAGMILGLCGQAAAGRGWRQYLARTGLLVLSASVLQEGFLSVFSWLMPLNGQSGSFSAVIGVFLKSLPALLLVNMVGAVLLSAFLALAFVSRKKDEGRPIGFKGGEIQSV